jgi:rhodanese-related sulfurtransferase
MQKNGFQGVMVVKGGFDALIKAGFPLEPK